MSNDSSSRLTPGQLSHERERATRWLEEHWPEPRVCVICLDNTWTVGSVVEAPLYRTDGLYPYVPVSCTKCANTLFFNAIQMGLFEGEEQLR
ncbi:MAG TPA: hypothetical protein VIC06_06780 [Solirubrobacteraceae bacterium]